MNVRTKFVQFSAGGHTVERGANGRPNVGRYVDELVAKLKVRAATIERVKEYLRKPEDKAALDAMLQHWFRWPSKRWTVLKQIRDTLKPMKLGVLNRGQAESVFNGRHFQMTWDD